MSLLRLRGGKTETHISGNAMLAQPSAMVKQTSAYGYNSKGSGKKLDRIQSTGTTAFTNKKVSPSTERGRGMTSTVSEENNAFKTPGRNSKRLTASGKIQGMRKSMNMSSKVHLPRMPEASSPRQRTRPMSGNVRIAKNKQFISQRQTASNN